MGWAIARRRRSGSVPVRGEAAVERVWSCWAGGECGGGGTFWSLRPAWSQRPGPLAVVRGARGPGGAAVSPRGAEPSPPPRVGRA